MLLNGSRYDVYLGDCLEVMRQLPDNSIDAIVSDPPYGLKFMGKQWDHGVPGVEFWQEMLRVAKPGAHLFAFGGDRTYHRLACGIEDAGWDLRRMFVWIYGSGFPKSLDISKAMDKAAELGYHEHPDDTPISDLAKQWSGWGTDIKPALEPIALARKPFKGTVCDNVLQWGTGGLNIDGCRVPTGDSLGGGATKAETVCANHGEAWARPWNHDPEARERHASTVRENVTKAERLGRFPANLIHDGSEEAIAGFPITNPSKAGRMPIKARTNLAKGREKERDYVSGHNDSGGSASRYFYCAKVSPSERGSSNIHPTVKPLALMRYLCRLITPPNGIILDPFMGSGSTGVAALQEGFRFIGIEKSPEYLEIAKARLNQSAPTVTDPSIEEDLYEF